ncbi:hypothetical protein DFJ73DRAFT_876248 [Zopfochytrium polystomum]|nr:hypothetical protein DFJ73DRAFT_876248 [Zopfochytrium polystomum]
MLPFQRVDGKLVPLAIESWITFTLVFLLLRWLHTTLILLNAFPSFALREFSNDFGWVFFHIAVLLFVFALLHATPILSSIQDDRYPLLRAVSRFQTRYPVLFHALYFSNIVLSFVPTAVATATGAAADRGDIAAAVACLRAHYLVWVAEIVELMAYFVACGLMLSMHIADRVHAARISGLDGPSVREITASMQSMQTMIVLENSLAFFFIVILAGYSFFRVSIHSTPLMQYSFTAGYIFSLPTGIFVSYAAILRGSYAVGKAREPTAFGTSLPLGSPLSYDSDIPLAQSVQTTPVLLSPVNGRQSAVSTASSSVSFGGTEAGAGMVRSV